MNNNNPKYVYSWGTHASLASSLTKMNQTRFNKSVRFLHSFDTMAIYLNSEDTVVVSSQNNTFNYECKNGVLKMKATKHYIVIVDENQDVEIFRINYMGKQV